jgi:hypothetical protein
MMPPVKDQLRCALDGDLGVVSARIARMVKKMMVGSTVQ